MRLKGRQARFLALILGLWVAARVAQHGSAPRDGDVPARIAASAPMLPLGGAGGDAAPGFQPWEYGLARDGLRAAGSSAPIPRPGMAMGDPTRAATLLLLRTLGAGGQIAAHAVLRRAVYAAAAEDEAPPADAAPIPPAPDLPPRRGGPYPTIQSYLFVRPGSGRAAISPQGQLGGSQFAARAAVPVARTGPIAISATARLYAPLASRGAEAAGGIDLAPAGGMPIRLSIERRQRLDGAGRSAWSAYVAGGFYREAAAGRIIVDGYAQSGIVGLRRADRFIDGAIRTGARIGGAAGPILGAGLWGAAQPGVARLDAGPRVAWRPPIADRRLILAVEGRFRLAGRARPGSGAALTLAADL